MLSNSSLAEQPFEDSSEGQFVTMFGIGHTGGQQSDVNA